MSEETTEEERDETITEETDETIEDEGRLRAETLDMLMSMSLEVLPILSPHALLYDLRSMQEAAETAVELALDTVTDHGERLELVRAHASNTMVLNGRRLSIIEAVGGVQRGRGRRRFHVLEGTLDEMLDGLTEMGAPESVLETLRRTAAAPAYGVPKGPDEEQPEA
jgi:hypothetical protein